MPAAVAAAAIGAGVSYLAGTSIALVAASFVANVALSYATKALAKKPSAPSVADYTRARLITAREAVKPRRIVAGETRIGGNLNYLESSNGESHLHFVVSLAGHEVDGIPDIYFDDRRATLDANGNGTGVWAGLVRVQKKLGTADQTAFADLIAESGGLWTSAHRGKHVACIYVRLLFNADVFPSGMPNVTAVVRGRKVYDPRIAATVWSPNPALILADYLCDTRYGVGVSYATGIDEEALVAAANICDEMVDLDTSAGGVTFTASAASDELALTAAHGLQRGDGVTLSSTSVLPSPLQVDTVYHWIPTGPLSGQLATSLANARAGTAIGLTDAGSGTQTILRVSEVRYSCNGSFESDERPSDIIPRLLSAMVGKAVRAGGVWRILAGEYRAPTVTLDENDLRDGIKLRTLVSRRENFNAVKGVFVSPDNGWQPADFPPVISETFLAQDSGRRAYKDLDLAFTTSPSMAQRLAKIDLLRVRQGKSATLPCKLSALRVQVGDTVAVTNARLGWSAKPFEVIGVTLDLGGEGGAMGVDLQLRETAASVYDWSTSEEQPYAVSPAPALSPAAPAPSNVLADPGSYWTFGSLTVTWETTAAAFVRWHQLEYRHPDETVWRVAGRTQDTSFAIDDALRAGEVFLRVRTMSIYGVERLSDQATVTIGAAEVMPRVTGLELRGGGANGDSFAGKDAKFVWREASQTFSYELGDEPEGAGDGARDLYFMDFEIRVVDPADGAVVRVEHTLDPFYDYGFEKNAEDYAAAHGEAGAFREFTVEVYQRGRQNQLSAIAARLTVSNPSPPLPDNLIVTTDFHNVLVSHRRPAGVLDWEGIEIHISTEDGFTPNDETLAYRGPDTFKALPRLPETTYYVRVRSYDSFGTTGLNESGQFSVTTGLIGEEYIASLTADKITSGTLDVATTIDVGDGLTIDGGDGRITVADDQGSPQTRVRLGNLGGGPADYGIEIYDESGNEIVGANGLGLNVVGTTNLADAAITAAKVGDAEIKTAKIENLNVTTIKVADNGITVGGAAQTAGTNLSALGTHPNSPVFSTVQSVVFTSQGNPVKIDFSFGAQNTSSGFTLHVQITRQVGTGTAVEIWRTSGSNYFIERGGSFAGYIHRDGSVIDTPGAGAITYRLNVSGDDSGGTINARQIGLFVLENLK